MLFGNFVYKNKMHIGVIKEEYIIPINKVLNRQFGSITDFIENFSKKFLNDLNNIDISDGIKLEDVKILAPIINPKRNIICVGKNYVDHIEEVASKIGYEHEIPKHPIFFTKMVDRMLGPNDNINLHSDITNKLDYEGELAIIIGKDGKDIPKDKVHKHIFGYTILNDISARDIQRQSSQWFRGKSLDGTCPIGPFILYKDSIAYPPKLNITSSINGDIRQKSNTENMIFDIDTLISELSKGITLKRGDIISTGTPSGVGIGMNNETYLKKGDKVEIKVEKIGILINYVK